MQKHGVIDRVFYCFINVFQKHCKCCLTFTNRGAIIKPSMTNMEVVYANNMRSKV